MRGCLVVACQAGSSLADGGTGCDQCLSASAKFVDAGHLAVCDGEQVVDAVGGRTPSTAVRPATRAWRMAWVSVPVSSIASIPVRAARSPANVSTTGSTPWQVHSSRSP